MGNPEYQNELFYIPLDDRLKIHGKLDHESSDYVVKKLLKGEPESAVKAPEFKTSINPILALRQHDYSKKDHHSLEIQKITKSINT